MIASSGEFSDFQEVVHELKDMKNQDYLSDDKIQFTPKDYGNYLARIQYKRRNDFDPYYL